jgi:cation-transporting ATPase 13A1
MLLLMAVYCCPWTCQATLSGLLSAGMFFFISHAKPLEKLSATRPHPSIFCLYFFISLLGQFAVQLGFLIFMYRSVSAAPPPPPPPPPTPVIL